MAIDLDALLDSAKAANIEGIVDVRKTVVGEERQEIVAIDFLRLKGAFRNDKNMSFRMIVGVDNPSEQPNDLRFLVVNLNQCEPRSLDLTIYMDANGKSRFGAHKWNPETGNISFTYTLPIPEGAEGFPDSETLQQILQEMYTSLLFYELKQLHIQILQDDMLSDDECRAKRKKLQTAHDRLIGPRETDDAV